MNTLYLAVLILFEQNIPVARGSLIYTVLRGAVSFVE